MKKCFFVLCIFVCLAFAENKCDFFALNYCPQKLEVKIIEMKNIKGNDRCDSDFKPSALQIEQWLKSDYVLEFEGYPAVEFCYYDCEKIQGKLTLNNEIWDFELESFGLLTLRKGDKDRYFGCSKPTTDLDSGKKLLDSPCAWFASSIYDCGI